MTSTYTLLKMSCRGKGHRSTPTRTHVQFSVAEQCSDGTNKKVVAEGDRYYSEGTGKHYDNFVRRYVMRCEVMDHTGKCTFNVFNDQAEEILGCTADEISASKESGDKAYDITLKNALLVPYVFRVRCHAEEYNNEARMRFAAARIEKVDYVKQSQWLINQILSIVVSSECRKMAE